jgi:glycosyltransferase involved in cell wall biosynthesis
MSAPLVSVLINNYNYGRFLRDCIDSALNQTYTKTEVIVVDDGSTDDSREIVASYGDKIIAVLKENGGQASAFNAGFTACKGDVVCLLDSDDLFRPSKLERVVAVLQEGFCRREVLLYHLSETVDEAGRPMGSTMPTQLHRCEPNLVTYACRYAFLPFAASPTSGLVITKGLAKKIFPIPCVRVSADDFVVRVAALLGEVRGIPEVLGAYRHHAANNWLNSGSLKSREFMEELQTYLNHKLAENRLNPVIDFFRSMYSRPYAEGSFSRLSRLALAVIGRRQDPLTMRFFLKTEAMALTCLLRGRL